MTLAGLRRKQKRVAPTLLALFMSVWLNLVLQPCVMAFSGDPCPHCPPHHSEASTGHEHPASDSDGREDREALHDGAARNSHQMPCDISGDCSPTLGAGIDSRVTKGIAQDIYQTMSVALPLDTSLPVADLHTFLAPFRDYARYPGVSPSLSILYCVYLD